MKTRKFPNPTLMSAAELDEAIETQMGLHPNGSPYADLLIEEFERRDGSAPCPAVMSAKGLDETYASEIERHPHGSALTTEVIDTIDRRSGSTVTCAVAHD
ncbi:hypothetical protein [Gordonia malaquae]|uniref:hypothetical protein n=1 Tax=Gordonia malaquae TaxID=410332 RepID=UPI0030164F5E